MWYIVKNLVIAKTDWNPEIIEYYFAKLKFLSYA